MASVSHYSVLFFLFGFVAKVTKGILCYECINMKSHKDCLKYGKITRCMSNQNNLLELDTFPVTRAKKLKPADDLQDSCQTEVRLHRYWKEGKLVTKSCKQTRACINNYLQNAAVCKPRKDDSVCYCCCHRSRCNLPTDICYQRYINGRPTENRKDKCKKLDKALKYGTLNCTNGTNVGSVCLFLSRFPDNMTDFNKKCIKNSKGRLVWVDEPVAPSAGNNNVVPPGDLKDPGKIVPPGELTDENDRPSCSNPLVFPNQIVTCDQGNEVGSRCRYDCEVEYELDLSRSEQVVTCIVSSGEAFWSDFPPPCILKEVKKCEELEYDEDEFIDSVCSDGSLLGSICTFRCMVGFMLIPFESSTMKCEENVNGSLLWSSEVPVCRPLSCASFEVENGMVNCTNEFFYDSKCEVKCFSGHIIQPPDYDVSTCLQNLTWSYMPPTCEAVFCPVYQVKYGAVECTNGAYMDSACRVSCNRDGHKIRPSSFDSSTCLLNGTWTHEPPCCARDCPPIGPIDMVIILDSSTSIGKGYWNRMTRFVAELISSVDVGPNSTNFAVFQYHRMVNEMTEIMLNEYHDHESLRKAVLDMPYKGRGTWTGIALGHAITSSLHPNNGNRPQYHDIVLLITDGQKNDRDDPLGPAEMLLRLGAKVFVIGIKPERFGTKNYSWKQLEKISGYHNERIFVPKEGIIQSLTPKEIFEAVTKAVCESLCEKP